jgi:hypothetical protein
MNEDISNMGGGLGGNRKRIAFKTAGLSFAVSAALPTGIVLQSAVSL